ncbi:MAG: AraC family transcriptional regulator [Muribaculaceae bacterium]|nr:AraC family transcriptional regulator [Muribaculaceae bacterium]
MADTTNTESFRTYEISEISRYFNRKSDNEHPVNYAVYYEIDSTLHHDNAQVRLLGLTIALCLEGEGEIKIGMKKYKLNKNSITLLSPNHYVHSAYTKSPVKTIALGFNLEMSESILHKLSSRLLPIIIHSPIENVTTLSEERAKNIEEMMRLIGSKINSPETPLKRTKISNLIQALLCEIVEDHYISKEGEVRKCTRKEEILSKFVMEIIRNFRSERSVAFYADKLCMTPKHLSAVSKEITSQTASELIDHYVIMEAKTMLAETTLTIQEISNKLNFANQSFFGKYFKHLTGYSPSAFRKMTEN